MDPNVKIALVLIVVIVGGIVGISAALTTLDATMTDSTVNTSSTPVVPTRPSNPAPDLVGIAHYLNTTQEALAAQIEDSVVLYDIWTYSCINCIRTLPYITSWNEKYADEGLLIIGVHSPEFEFEKNRENVEFAIQKHGITYPVVMDNDMETWKAFENRYWPRKYIADHEGNIRYDHIGEGDYENTERVIQSLLRERADALDMDIDSTSSIVDIAEYENEGFTRELYFGFILARGNQLGSPEGFTPGSDVTYTIPDDIQNDRFYLDGTWSNLADGMKLVSESGRIVLSYHAKQVNIVAGSSMPGKLGVYLDSEPITSAHAGADITDGTVMISEHELYNIITSPESQRHTLELYTTESGFEIFTFTFG